MIAWLRTVGVCGSGPDGLAARRFGAGLSEPADYRGRAVPTRRVDRWRGAIDARAAQRSAGAADRDREQPGAGGTTGSATVANARPDGYTLLITVNPPLTMNMYMQKNFPYDAKTAFAPIALAANSILVLAVNAALPVKTVAELVDYAKKNPRKLSYGSSGIGSGHHIAGELLKQRTGIDMVHVPYRGTAPAIQDLIAGNIRSASAPARGAAASCRRYHPHHCARRGEAASRPAGDSDHRRDRARRRHQYLAWIVRSRRHAAADRRSPE